MFAKVFTQILDSSLAEDYHIRLVFEDFLKLCDHRGVVDMTPESIARRTNVPLEIVKRGIESLERPDPRSRSADHEGRRIIRLDDHRDWGWMVVNYTKYRKIASEEQRREQTSERVRSFRERKSSVTHCNAMKPGETKSLTPAANSGQFTTVGIDACIEPEQKQAQLQLSQTIENQEKQSSCNALKRTVTHGNACNAMEKDREKYNTPPIVPHLGNEFENILVRDGKEYLPIRDIPKEAETIYQAYPRKIGRPAAIRAIQKSLRDHPFKFVLEKTQAYARSRIGQDPTFTPYPQKWFNQERFMEDPSSWEPIKFPATPQKPKKSEYVG